MEYAWTISAMDCKVQEGTLINVVQTIHWRYKATEIVPGISGSADTTYVVEIYGAAPLSEPTPETFTDYNSLTETQVIGWLEGTLNMEEIQTKLTDEINLQINPVNVTLPPPF